MTADRRLRLGAWAALLVAFLAPLRLVALFASAGAPEPSAAPAVLLVEIAILAGVLGALVGLKRLFSPFAAERWAVITVLAAAGAGVGIGIDVLTVAGYGHGLPVDLARLLGGVLVAAWFVGGGTILMSGGRELGRIGWPGLVGGAAATLAAVASALRFGDVVGPGPDSLSLRGWLNLIGLFVTVYLVRIWLYVVRGRLPGPGIL